MWVLMRRPFRQLFLKVLGYYNFEPFGAETIPDPKMDAKLSKLFIEFSGPRTFGFNTIQYSNHEAFLMDAKGYLRHISKKNLFSAV
jgi:hypothetical protein